MRIDNVYKLLNKINWNYYYQQQKQLVDYHSMGDKYEDLGPANALPPPPPQPEQILPTITPGQASQDRTELRSAQIGSSIIKKAAQGKDPKKTLADEDEEEEIKYTTAQKTCMVISGTEKNKLERIFYLFLRTNYFEKNLPVEMAN
ncbi:hypothetical protein QQG55_15300 [Brugia pahangi]